MQTRNLLNALGFGRPMFANPRSLTVAVISLCALLLAPNSRANILNDILNAANTATSRATQARDRATEARDNAADALDQANQIRSTIQTGLQTLSGQVRTFITDGLQEASRVVTEETDGRDAFVNGPEGPAFRQDLLTLLQNLQTIFNQLTLIADPGAPQISFNDEIQLIQTIPLQVLFPLHRAMQPMSPLFSNLPAELGNAADALPILRQILESRYTAGAPLGSRPDSFIDYELGQTVNLVILNNPVAVSNAAKAVRGGGIAVKVLGKILEARGHTGLAAIPLQIHGYAGVSLASDQKMKWGTTLTGIGELLLKVAEAASNNMDHAMLIGSLSELRDNQTEILDNQTTIKQNQGTIIENEEKILLQLNRAGPR